MSTKTSYTSKYSPDKQITAAQYINELVCEHKAAFDKTKLPIKFWNIPQWSNFYKRNIRQIAKLLKQFDEVAIIRALASPTFQKSYSIFTDRFIGLVEKEQSVLFKERDVKVIHKEVNRETTNNELRKPQKKTGGILSKLQDLE